MNRLHLRRAAALTAGALIGLAGVTAIASPASAHYSQPSGTAICDSAAGEWVVTWTVKSVYHYDSTHFGFQSVEVTPAGTTVSGIAVSDANTYPVNTPVTGVQRVPGSATEATLSVKAKWNDGYPEKQARTAKVTFEGTCAKDEPPATSTPEPAEPSPQPSPSATTPPPVSIPTASFASDCTGKVTVTLANSAEATTDTVLTVRAKDFTRKATVKPGGQETVVVPAGAGEVTVSEGEQLIGKPYTWTSPEDCVKPGEPQAGYESTCDKLIFGFANPENGKAFDVTLTPNKGEAQTRTVKPGETVIVEFKAFEGLVVTPSAEGLDDTSPIAWKKPANCSPGTGGGEDDGPTLPLTGAAIGGIVAGAIALLAAGAVLFVVARRRKVRFTA